jgi:hypothetical protein
MTSQARYIRTSQARKTTRGASYLIRLGFALGIPVGIGVDIALGIAVVARATASRVMDQFW